jgi:DinB superfamily
MKKTIFLAGAIIASSFAILSNGTLTGREKKFAIDYLNKARTRLYEDIRGLNSAQLNFKADSSRWSVAQCVEHIALAENGLWQRIDSTLKKPVMQAKQQLSNSNEQLIAKTLDRSVKYKAPDQLVPMGYFSSTDKALNYFSHKRDSIIDYLRVTRDDLKDRYFVHSSLGTINLYQAFLLIASHSERHIMQIEEVKANPGFPKN